MSKRIKVLELFGGIGAPRQALINLGIDHKAIDYVEIDKKAVQSYNVMYPKHYEPENVINYNLLPDLVIHGSPCQDHSRANRKLGNMSLYGTPEYSKTRSSLMFETLKIIEDFGEKWRPKVVIWENVKGVLDKNMRQPFEKYLEKMESLGYTNSYDVLNALDFGVPQNRERIFVVSILDGRQFDFDNLERKPLKPISQYLEKDVDEKYTVTSPSMLKNIKGSPTYIPPSETKFKGRIEVIKSYYPESTITEQGYCNTVTTKQDRNPNSGVIQLESGDYRLITEREAWRLMGYSDGMFQTVSNAHYNRPGTRNGTLYQQAGNSIVVDVLEAIFKELFKDDVELFSEKQLSIDSLISV